MDLGDGMKVIAIDDEKSMLLLLEKMMEKIPELELAGAFQSTRDAYAALEEQQPDMVIIDINMPEENGLEFARKVRQAMPNVDIVFLTSHKEFALEAFDVNAIDYIVKPVYQERLERMARRVQYGRHALQTAVSAEKTKRLFVYCLGGFDIRDRDGKTVRLSSSKSAELFAFLLMYKGKFVSKWNVMETVFRGMSPHNAETYLNTTVYKLRKALEPYGMKAAIVTANESYRVEMNEIYVDYDDFEHRISHFDDISLSTLNAALEAEQLYAGELFGDRDYHWSLPEQERLANLLRSLGKKLGAYLLASGASSEALQILQKIAVKNELDEEINCLYMQVYAAKRDKLSLIKHYERYSKTIQRELGVAPGKTVTSLYTELCKGLS